MRHAAKRPLLAAVVVVPLLRATWCYDDYGLPRLAAAAVLVLAGALLAARQRRAPATALDAPVLALAAAFLLSAAFAREPWDAWLGGHGRYAWSVLGWAVCACAFWLASAVGGDGFDDELIAAAACASLVVSLCSVLQLAGLDWNWKTALFARARGRYVSTFGGPVPLGAFLALAAPLWLSLAFEKRRRNLGLACLALGLVALAASGTRSAWLGACAGALAWALLSGRVRARLKLGLSAGAGMLCAAGLIAAASRHAQGDAARWATWGGAWTVFRAEPWLGVGPNGFPEAFHAIAPAAAFAGHAMDIWQTQADALDDWLTVAATLGACGLLACLSLHAWAALELRRRVRGGLSPGRAALACGIFGLLVQAKLNALGWEALFLAAVFAGALFRSPGRGRWRGLALAALSGAAATFSARLAWADHLEAAGLAARAQGRPREAAELLERAAALNAGEPYYRQNLDNLLWDVAASSAELQTKRALLLRARDAAAEGALRRPADASMLALLGEAELRRAAWGGAPAAGAAVKAFEAALRRDVRTPGVHPGLTEALWRVAAAARAGERHDLLERAIEVAAEGLALRPGDAAGTALLGLAELRAAQIGGETTAADAARRFEEALRLDPETPGARENLDAARKLVESGNR